VDSLLDRCGGHHGAHRLRRVLTEYREPAFTRSALERRFLELVRRSGLPRPATNRFVAGFEIDMYWAGERFGVELDTYEFHGGRVAFERDRLRQEELKLAGIETVRITGGRLDREPEAVIERLASLLSGRRRELGLQ
jgi:very-short-patch-repair endonuclease